MKQKIISKLNCFGLIQTNSTIEGCIKSTIFFYFLLYQKNQFEAKDLLRLEETMKQLEVVPGLYKQYANNDNISLSLESYAIISCFYNKINFKGFRARDIYKYGRRHLWSYDVVKKKFSLEKHMNRWHIYCVKRAYDKIGSIFGLPSLYYNIIKTSLYSKYEYDQHITNYIIMNTFDKYILIRPLKWMYDKIIKKREITMEKLCNLKYGYGSAMALLAKEGK